MRREEQLQIAVCKYINFAYPGTVVISEASGVRTSIGVATKLKKMRSPDTHLDLYILKPSGGYYGLIIELKAQTACNKNGSLKQNDHVRDQQKTIDKLNGLGYYATFAIEFDQAKRIIDEYMNG